jgi:hypothetical protein
MCAPWCLASWSRCALGFTQVLCRHSSSFSWPREPLQGCTHLFAYSAVGRHFRCNLVWSKQALHIRVYLGAGWYANCVRNRRFPKNCPVLHCSREWRQLEASSCSLSPLTVVNISQFDVHHSRGGQCGLRVGLAHLSLVTNFTGPHLKHLSAIHLSSFVKFLLESLPYLKTIVFFPLWLSHVCFELNFFTYSESKALSKLCFANKYLSRVRGLSLHSLSGIFQRWEIGLFQWSPQFGSYRLYWIKSLHIQNVRRILSSVTF